MRERYPARSFDQPLSFVVLVVFVLTLSACATPQYSEELDKSVMATAKELNTFLTTNSNKSESVQYSDVVDGYNKVEVLYDDMLLTVRLLPKYQEVVRVAEDSYKRFLTLREEHKKAGFKKPGYFAVQKKKFAQDFYDLLSMARISK